MDALVQYRSPDNVVELQDVIERTVILSWRPSLYSSDDWRSCTAKTTRPSATAAALMLADLERLGISQSQ
jgi:transcriptional regulator with GAF, ATPase, and Fis domain